MSGRLFAAALVLAVGFVLPRAHAPAALAEPVAPAAAPQDGSTTLDDQSELAVTVYNSDIALVRDVRNLRLARGR